LVHHRPRWQRTARAGQLADITGQPADGAGDRQSRLAVALRQGTRDDAVELRAAWRVALASGASRLADGGICARRLVGQAVASVAPSVEDLPSGIGRRAGERNEGPRQSLVLALRPPAP